MCNMDEEKEKIAPTVSIETVIVVRPMKVMAVMLGFVAILLMILVVGASSWVKVSVYREGLWDRCYITGPGRITCQEGEERSWILACRALCVLAGALCFVAGVVTSRGLCAMTFRKRYRCYFVAMLIYFLAVFFNITALIIFPIKYDEELRRNGIKEWVFGWAYGLGWGVTVIILISAFLLWLDKDADEIIFREKTSYNNEGIEEVF